MAAILRLDLPELLGDGGERLVPGRLDELAAFAHIGAIEALIAQAVDGLPCLSEIHSSLTSSFRRGSTRMTCARACRRGCWSRSASMTSTDSVLVSSHDRASKA